MIPGVVLLGLLYLFQLSTSADLPTNYEYYASEGIESGLSADQPYFTLNGKNISIYSGAMHYFRVPRAYWRDRLQKIRAAGLNTVETYVAWHIHEPENGLFEFGESGSEMEDFAHLEEFLDIAQEEDLFVIVRSGPYICAEYNFGGFPAWLLREGAGFRTTEATYIKYVTRYFNVLLPLLKNYQFTQGGPVIAFQVENEYGYMNVEGYTPEKEYLEELRQLYIKNDIVELLVTSDGARSGLIGSIADEFLQTVNFGSDAQNQLDTLAKTIPNRPIMTMEYWIGWFDHWAEDHHTVAPANSMEIYETILKYPASVNIYMFHGGTNFGFTSGGSLGDSGKDDNSDFQPVTTSYDYDSPLNEAGDYTDKYFQVKELLEKYNPVKTFVPDPPALVPKVAYPAVTVEKQLPFVKVLDDNAPYVITSKNVVAMEKLDINNGSGQSVGYIAYRKENVDLGQDTVLKIEGHICDTAVVMVDGVIVSPILTSKDDLNSFGYWREENSTLLLNSKAKSNVTIDIIVEEWGRMNGGTARQYKKTFKGLWQGDVYLNDTKISDWKIVPLEFKKNWTNNLQGWSENSSSDGPGLFYGNLEISSEPSDTYLDMRKWTKGLVIVNGFPLGKYAMIGPQQSLYLPAPFLKTGSNDIVIFEHFKADYEIRFATKPIWRTV